MKLQRRLTREARLAKRYKLRQSQAIREAQLAALMPPKVAELRRPFGEWLHTPRGRAWRLKRKAA